jgi:hypothetical protein
MKAKANRKQSESKAKAKQKQSKSKAKAKRKKNGVEMEKKQNGAEDISGTDNEGMEQKSVAEEWSRRMEQTRSEEEEWDGNVKSSM